MQYDHSRKAGNAGDVWKHAVLLALAGTMPVGNDVLYVESHSGAPVHPLTDNGEWQRGVGRVLASSICDSEYRTALGPWLLRKEYPASWVLVANRFAKRADTVRVELADTSEVVAEACNRRQVVLGSNVRANFRCMDGFDLVVGAEQASLVFLDPPFADRERDWQLLAGTCMCLRDRDVPFAAWYPYAWRTFPDWIIETTQCETWEVLWAKCGAKPSQDLKGCGMLVSEGVSAALNDARSALDPLIACLKWELCVRRPQS